MIFIEFISLRFVISSTEDLWTLILAKKNNSSYYSSLSEGWWSGSTLIWYIFIKNCVDAWQMLDATPKKRHGIFN